MVKPPQTRSDPRFLPLAGIKPRRFAFVMVPEFSMMPFTAAIEPLRVANRMNGAPLYSWRTASIDGTPVAASNGVVISPDTSLAEALDADTIVVCAGLNTYAHAGSAIIAPLRRASRRGAMLGSVCTGSVVLARAGLLDGHRCTIHWEDLASFAENFPQLEVTSRLYEIDGDRFTCSGGTAPLDLMIHFIALDFGHDLAVRVADQMLHHLAREANEPQRLSLEERTGLSHPKLLAAIAQMEARLETPAPLEEIARRAGLSVRQLERLFRTLLGTSPSRHYLGLRLEKARNLLVQTAMPLAQVAVACGFASPAHFTRTYHAAFGRTPSSERQRH